MPTVNIDHILPRVQKPARYTGGEWNSTTKDWDACDLRIALAYPDLYDIGMSNMGIGILYDIVNRREGMLAERVYAPWTDLEQIMRDEHVPLWSLETRHPISEFDILGFSLSYEGTYTNILNMLDLAGIPVLAKDRNETHPLIICGGSGALNPDALADFIDVFVLGDGEEAILDVVDTVRKWKRDRAAPAVAPTSVRVGALLAAPSPPSDAARGDSATTDSTRGASAPPQSPSDATGRLAETDAGIRHSEQSEESSSNTTAARSDSVTTPDVGAPLAAPSPPSDGARGASATTDSTRGAEAPPQSPYENEGSIAQTDAGIRHSEQSEESSSNDTTVLGDSVTTPAVGAPLAAPSPPSDGARGDSATTASTRGASAPPQSPSDATGWLAETDAGIRHSEQSEESSPNTTAARSDSTHNRHVGAQLAAPASRNDVRSSVLHPPSSILARIDLLRSLQKIWGTYNPRFYQPVYNEDGSIKIVEPTEDWLPKRVTKRFVQQLPPPLTKPIVPFLQTVHDRMAIEIQRGCTQGCRFCQAGIIYRPRLERDPEEVVAAAKELRENTGYDELSLVSLSTTDHSRIVEIAEGLREEFGDDLTISLPSMRVDSFSVRISELVAQRGKHSITFAPEAGTERLRMTINKIVTDEDLFTAVDNAFAQGWTNVKMYFMVGQPTETHEDIEGIVALAKKVKEIGRRYHGGRARVRVSTSNFIPKAHTPFQYAVQEQPGVLRARHHYLRDHLKKIGVQFTWEDPEHSLLEAVLSRGDRRLGKAIHRAWELGARFDAWHEHYDWNRWLQAFEETGVDPKFYAYRQPDAFSAFPWSHINIGVTESYLRAEWMRTLNSQTTADCHKEPCNVCGVQNQNAEDCLDRLDLKLEAAGKPKKPREGLIRPIEMFSIT